MSYLTGKGPTNGPRGPLGHDGLSGFFDGVTRDAQPSNPTADKIGSLQAQLNRYVGFTQVPPGVVAPQWSELPVTGILDKETATRALTVALWRAGETGDGDTITRFAAGFIEPIAFVTVNLDSVLQLVKIFGDLHGVPPAKQQVFGVSLKHVAIAAVAIGALLYLRKKR